MNYFSVTKECCHHFISDGMSLYLFFTSFSVRLGRNDWQLYRPGQKNYSPVPVFRPVNESTSLFSQCATASHWETHKNKIQHIASQIVKVALNFIMFQPNILPSHWSEIAACCNPERPTRYRKLREISFKNLEITHEM